MERPPCFFHLALDDAGGGTRKVEVDVGQGTRRGVGFCDGDGVGIIKAGGAVSAVAVVFVVAGQVRPIRELDFHLVVARGRHHGVGVIV